MQKRFEVFKHVPVFYWKIVIVLKCIMSCYPVKMSSWCSFSNSLLLDCSTPFCSLENKLWPKWRNWRNLNKSPKKPLSKLRKYSLGFISKTAEFRFSWSRRLCLERNSSNFYMRWAVYLQMRFLRWCLSTCLQYSWSLLFILRSQPNFMWCDINIWFTLTLLRI